MKRFLTAVSVAACLLAACGGGDSPPPPMPTPAPAVAASPASVNANMYGGEQSFAITLSGTNLSGLQWTAGTLSFLNVSLQQNTASTATLNVLLTSPGTTTIDVRTANGASASIPVSAAGCGKPDALDYAALIAPPNGARSVPLTTSSYYVEVGAIPVITQSPFEPVLHAHIVVNDSSALDPQAPLAPATPPPGAASPSPAPNGVYGYEEGAMPQLAAGNTYTVYVYDDSCEPAWYAGSFST
jgi:hypothetical protein